MKTFFYPHMFFITLLNSIMIATCLGAGYTVAPALLTAPNSWPFAHLGLSLITVLISATATAIISGYGADTFANWMSRKTGRREPEIQALNLIVPTVTGLIGTILFAIAGDDPNRYPWPVFLLGLGFIAFGFLSTSSIGLVYVLESYPHLAGAAIVNIASFRCLIAFLLTFRISEWVANMGYLKTFGIYAGVMGGFILFIPIIYVFGPGWRRRWPGPKQNL
jgi:MFS family permease